MKVLFLDRNNVLTDVAKEFELAKGLDDADRVVVWSDVTVTERSAVDIARRYKKPTITVQHGRRGTSRYYPPFNEKIWSDKLLVWGESDKEALIKAGQDPKKIKVTGTTVTSHIKERQPHEGINIVFSPEHWDYEVEENRQVAAELKKLKGVNIITKIIHGHNPDFYQNPVFSDRNAPDHLDICIDVLSKADLVVGISESTFELLAQAMDIPVVIMEEWAPKTFSNDKRYTEGYRRIISRASKKTTVKNLNETIKQQLKNPDELKKERMEVAREDGGVHLNALELIKEEIRCGLKRN